MFVLAATCVNAVAATERLPERDVRLTPPQDLNTKRVFPTVASRDAWEARAREIREQILVSCGLWPMPQKTPSQPVVFGRVERDGYTVEKVHIQPFPGFYLAGNLYRPLGQGPGPFPGVLNPHGHWQEGRLADNERGSIAGRCIGFARQGMVAFSYDMVGYNDTAQVKHTFANQPANQLWSISLMGLQTWNSIRALDFLESLPDVDRSRLACTGESGGGTQTFMLGAIDDRLRVQAPVVMVSHSMQGGCLCENAPGLRVEYSNMEIAAVPAPRAQILVAATGDWTKLTPSVEGPAVQSVYALFQAPERLRYELFDFVHNYNQTSREAVYAWFARWLRNQPDARALAEQPFKKESDASLRVWPDGKLPEDALDESEVIQYLIAQHQAYHRAMRPQDADSLARYQGILMPAWRHSLQITPVESGQLLVATSPERSLPTHRETRGFIGRKDKGDRIPVAVLAPKADPAGVAAAKAAWTVVLVHPEGIGGSLAADGAARGLARTILDRGGRVLLFDAFQTGGASDRENAAARQLFANYFTTYNRTDAQERAQDILTAVAFARQSAPARQVALCGVGHAGLWALLAAPGAGVATAVDANTLDASSDEALLHPEVFSPGLRKLGGFDGIGALAAPMPLLVHNTGVRFLVSEIENAYSAASASAKFTGSKLGMTEAQVAAWLQETTR
jgi:dienelactone hydrolase